MKKNLKKVRITIPNDEVLKNVNKTPLIRDLSRLRLQVGENTESVNNVQYSRMMRLYPLVGAEIKQIG
jgi:hypothetical protein